MLKAVFLRNYLLSLLVFNLMACSSMQTVDVASAMRYPPANVSVGSLVKVTTLNEWEFKFRVTEMDAAGLVGKYGFIPFEDMAALKVETGRSGDGSTAMVIWGILGVAALIALIDNADTVAICSGTPCIRP